MKNKKLSLFLEPIKTTVPLSTNIFTLTLMSKGVLFKQINETFLYHVPFLSYVYVQYPWKDL